MDLGFSCRRSATARSLHLGSVIPPGLVVDHIGMGAGRTNTARPKAASAQRPRCEGVSSRVHSRYTRTLSDLPVACRRVVITISVRRFRCIGSEGMPDKDLRRAARIKPRHRLRSAHGTVGGHRPSPRPRPRWQAGGELRPSADGAGEPGHAVADCAPPRAKAGRDSDRDQHRRLGLPPRATLRHADLRSGAVSRRRPSAGS